MISKEEAWDEAIDIVQNAWCQGTFHESTPKGDRYCALGAIDKAAGDGWVWSADMSMAADMAVDLARVIIEQHGDTMNYLRPHGPLQEKLRADPPFATDVIWRFNDHEASSKEDIIALMEKARAQA